VGDLPQSLAACGLKVLQAADPKEKIALSHRAWAAYSHRQLPVGAVSMAAMPDRPSRPERPELVHPKKIPNPKQSPLPLNVHMLHTLAHIELNAIDLAWDTVARFSSLGLPEAFYADFAHVADDESRHLGWCLQRLEELGHAYGDMPAHDLLWEGAQMSSDDLSWRMCMVPMAQEARGLDAGPRLADKLCGFGDNRTSKIVTRIAEEEKAHVAVGVVWFNRVCSALERPAEESFRDTMGRLCPDLLTGFFNHDARQEVGLPQAWYDLSAWPAEQAEPVCKSAGLDPTDPRKRCEPSAPKMSPPMKLDSKELEMLSSRLLQVLDVEVAGSER